VELAEKAGEFFCSSGIRLTPEIGNAPIKDWKGVLGGS
jgi:hypothetical protein